jgi:hypothetical protein
LAIAGELLRRASAIASRPSNSMRQFQLAISAFSSGLTPIRGGSGKRASTQAAIAALSVRIQPSSVRKAGTVHCGFTRR